MNGIKKQNERTLLLEAVLLKVMSRCIYMTCLPHFGVYLPQVNINFSTVNEITTLCEDLGYDSVWLFDHLLALNNPNDAVLECWTTLSALAATTKRIQLGPLVLCNSFRTPSVVAKMAATLDVISEGRLNFGIGAGWYRPEYEAYGIPFPNASARISQLVEAVQLMKLMWTQSIANFAGKFYSLHDAVCYPKPVQKPHPPIWIGVMIGRKKMIRAIGQYANGWTISSLYLPTPDEYAEYLSTLRAHMATHHRNIDEVKNALGVGCLIAENRRELEKKQCKYKPGQVSVDAYQAVQPRLMGTPDELVEQIHAYLDRGVTHFLLNFPDIRETKSLTLFAERVIQAL
jgi:alkanesulfonate monooxygenase SsuD/methylene tetrahydromethanopterin reductase-like flavin-dependent oxidoreductase (luciferase family)